MGHRIDTLRRHMLDMINSERSKAGLRAVVPGRDAAAQSHAHSMMKNGYMSHWGLNGMKPYMRYGGYQYNAENVSGPSYRIKSHQGYVQNHPRQMLQRSMHGLMQSPGHRDNILDPHHHAVNIGLAWDPYQMWVVQHFEYGYALFTRLPAISDGILTMSGMTIKRAGFGSDLDLGVQIFFDPLPHRLTTGQLARTSCYNDGMLMASLRPAHNNYTSDAHSVSFSRCPDPYRVPASVPPPASLAEAGRLHQKAKRASLTETYSIPWINADAWTVSDSFFDIKADISGILRRHGVYTVAVWGIVGGQRVPVAMVALFYGAPKPTRRLNHPKLR